MGHFSFGASPVVMALSVAGAATAGWLSRLTWLRNGGRKWLLGLESLRWCTVALVVFTLWRPEWIRVVNPNQKPQVVVLYDASRSMQTRDVVASDHMVSSREEWVGRQLSNEFWKPLELKYAVDVVAFSPALGNGNNSHRQPIPAPLPGGDSETNSPPPEGMGVAGSTATLEEGTDLNQALTDALARHRNLRAVLLLTDGDWNAGKSPVGAATALQLAHVPVFAMAVGSEHHLPDLDLQRVSAPAYGLLGEQVFVPFTVQSHLPREVKTKITVTGSDGSSSSKDLVIPARAQVQDALFWMPQREGEHTLTVKLPVEPDELRADNNEQSRRITVRREVLKVLVVDSLPRWEYRYLRNALERDPGAEVKCVLLHPGMKPGGGRDYLPAFPATKEALAPFDVVFLGDIGIGAGELTTADAENLRGLVEQQGSGLVFLPGRRGREITFRSTPLEELMPVILDETRPEGYSSATPSPLALTQLGRGHLLTMLASSESQNELIWQQLPGFYWHAAVTRSKPGGDVLAVHPGLRNQWGRLPLLVTRQQGNGKTLFMGTDAAWRWRRGVEDKYHYRFWGQVVRWMSYQRHRAQEKGLRVFFSPDTPQRGEEVTIHATVFDRTGLPLEKGTVSAELVAPGNKTERLLLTPAPGGWGVFEGRLVIQQTGSFKVKVRCEETGQELETELAVGGVPREQVGRPAQPEVLEEIAGLTQGKFGTLDNLKAFVDSISALPERQPMEQRLRLWCHPAWGALIVTLLAAYWIGRKMVGLV